MVLLLRLPLLLMLLLRAFVRKSLRILLRSRIKQCILTHSWIQRSMVHS